MLRRPVFVTWRTLLVKWMFIFCSQTLNDPFSAAAGSVCIKTKWGEIQPSRTPWKNLLARSTNFTVVGVLFPLPWSSYSTFRNVWRMHVSLFLPRIQNCSSSFRDTYHIWMISSNFINKSDNKTTKKLLNSTICHFGWRTTIRQRLSRAPQDRGYVHYRARTNWPRCDRSGHQCCDVL